MTLAEERYLLFTTFRRSGDAVATPVWAVPLADDRIGFWTSSGSGKAKRLAHTARVVVQPCDLRGRIAEGSAPSEGTAVLVTGDELEPIRTAVKQKYGFMTTVTKVLGSIGGFVKRNPIPYGDRGVVITLDS